MHRFWNSPRRAKVSLLTPALCLGALVLAGCGSSGGGAGSSASARTLLTQTFSGVHKIDSGQLQASLTVDPSGSTVITQPVSLSFGGPFQSRGKNQLPASDFDIAIGFQGHTGKLGIISTGTQGFVTLEGQAYKLPAASFKQLEGGVSAVGGNSSASASPLSGLGIHPQQWLSNPRIVGTQQIGGVDTEHIHGTLALGPLLRDLSTLLGKASSATSATASLKAISPAQQAKIESEVTHASFDLWTGTSDHTIRRLTVAATLPVTGSTSTALGGMKSARLSFVLGYSHIGQTQSIPTPTSSRPYAQFQKALSAIVLQIEELVVGASSGSSGASGSATTSGADGAYSQCVSAAGGSVAKIQKCAALLNGGG